MKKGMSKILVLALIGIFVISIAAISAVYVTTSDSLGKNVCNVAYNTCLSEGGIGNACSLAKGDCEKENGGEIFEWDPWTMGLEDEYWSEVFDMWITMRPEIAPSGGVPDDSRIVSVTTADGKTHPADEGKIRWVYVGRDKDGTPIKFWEYT